jgi:carbonic anhydrase/acetyltransferase-like protein (isoleucine patch superfamily)
MNAASILNKAMTRTTYNTGRVLKEAGLAMDRFGSRLHNDVAYVADLSRHRQVMPLYDAVPEVKDAWVAPNATVAGNVFVSKYASVWYGAVLRGELHPIRIGHFTSIGDRTTIHTNHSLPAGIAASVNIGKNVSVGPNCNIHSCIIDDDCVVGANVVIQAGARLERGCQILPNSIVRAGSLIPAGQVWGGSPVTFVRELSQEEQFANYTRSYTNGASAFDAALWPNAFDNAPAEGQTIDEYSEETYYRQQ